MIRPLILGTVGIVIVVFIVTWAELVTGRIMIGFLQLPPVVLPLLFLLIAANRLVRRWAPRAALAPWEIAVIYLMMVIAAMISSRGLMEDLLPVLVAVNYFASPSNRWKESFFPHIRPWMVPTVGPRVPAQPAGAYPPFLDARGGATDRSPSVAPPNGNGTHRR